MIPSILTFLLLASFACTSLGQTNTASNLFQLRINGRTVGKDTFSFTKTKQGWKLISQYRFAAAGTEGQFDSEYRFDDQYTFLEGGIENTANVAHYSFEPNKARTELTVATTQAGSLMNDIVDIKPDLVLLPDFDAGAAQGLLLHAVTHPTPDNKYTVLIPSFAGAASGGRGGRGAPAPAPADAANGADTLPPGNHSYQAVWVQGRDVTGSLDGKPLPLHTYLFAFGPFRWIFFADSGNSLMQLNVTKLHASYIRAGFVLDPIKATDAK